MSERLQPLRSIIFFDRKQLKVIKVNNLPTTSSSKDLVLRGWQQCHPTHETNPLEDETHFLS